MNETETVATSSQMSFGLDLPMSYEEARERVIAALKDQGFGVLTEIDVQATMKEKLDVDFRPYTIIGACNPPLAYRALSADLGIGLMLPCNVVVHEQEGGSRVDFLDPVKALAVVGNVQLEGVAEEARERLRRVKHALEAER